MDILYNVFNMAKLTYKQLIERHLKILKGLQTGSGLFLASKSGVETGYDKSWLRDNFYETIAFEIMGDWETVEKTYRAILNIFLKYEDKIDWAIKEKPIASYQYIHARFHPESFDEFWEEWGNKQNDAIGCILYRLGELEVNQKRSVIKTDAHVRIVNKLVRYLASIEFWHDRDAGIWETDDDVHSSSVGACVAGLMSIAQVASIEVPVWLVKKGQKALNSLLPRESEKKYVDLALLSLVWPYNVVDATQREIILENVEYHLLRDKGVIRYKGDHYYNKNPDGYSEEAEWTFGLSWLAIIYQKLGQEDKALGLIKELISIDTPDGMPELYFSNSAEYNENTPLGWSESLFIVALYQMERKAET